MAEVDHAAGEREGGYDDEDASVATQTHAAVTTTGRRSVRRDRR
jgi:hypothetical protein